MKPWEGTPFEKEYAMLADGIARERAIRRMLVARLRAALAASEAREAALEEVVRALLDAPYGCGCCGDWSTVLDVQDAARAALAKGDGGTT